MTRVASLTVWGLLAGGALACEVASLIGGRIAGFGRVLDVIAVGRWRTLPLFVGWMWLGWHFFAR